MANNQTTATTAVENIEKSGSTPMIHKNKVTVTRDHLVELIHQNSATTVAKTDIASICKSIVKEIENQLTHNREVKLSKFGTFGIRNRPPRTGKNPLTGEPVSVKATRSVYFRASAYIKNIVNQGASS